MPYFDEETQEWVYPDVVDTEHTEKVNKDFGPNLQEQIQARKEQNNYDNNQEQISIFQRFLGRK